MKLTTKTVRELYRHYEYAFLTLSVRGGTMNEAFEYAKIFERIPVFRKGVYQWKGQSLLLVTNTTFGGVIAFDGQREFIVKTDKLKHLTPVNFCLECGVQWTCACPGPCEDL